MPEGPDIFMTKTFLRCRNPFDTFKFPRPQKEGKATLEKALVDEEEALYKNEW